jgi:hypothetical protein
MFLLNAMKMPRKFIDFYAVFCKTIYKEAIWQPLHRGHRGYSLGSCPYILQMLSLNTMKMPSGFIDFYAVFCKTINKEVICQPLYRGHRGGGGTYYWEHSLYILNAFIKSRDRMLQDFYTIFFIAINK